MALEFVNRPISEFISPEEFGVFYHIITHRAITIGIENGGWIAGGFARTVLAGESIVDYFWPSDRKNLSFFGDIDIFFPDEESAKRANDAASACFSTPKYNEPHRFATDWLLRPSKNMHEYIEKSGVDSKRFDYIRVQYVTNPPNGFKKTLTDTIEDFDLVNCMVGIDGERIVFPKKWFELQKSKSLEINKSATPFLGRRLAKYLTHRNYLKITPNSKDLLIEWIARVKNDEWPNVFNSTHTKRQMMMNALSELLSIGDVSLTDIVILINKWTISKKVEENYGQTNWVSVDWALDKIESQIDVV
jgi:hypothetical protein